MWLLQFLLTENDAFHFSYFYVFSFSFSLYVFGTKGREINIIIIIINLSVTLCICLLWFFVPHAHSSFFSFFFFSHSKFKIKSFLTYLNFRIGSLNLHNYIKFHHSWIQFLIIIESLGAFNYLDNVKVTFWQFFIPNNPNKIYR